MLAETISEVTSYNFLESRSKVKTKCVAIDFSQGPVIYTKVKAALTGLDVGVLGMYAWLIFDLESPYVHQSIYK